MLPTTQLIDCRNSKEVAIGTFRSATNPKTRTFAEFGTWVDNNKADLIKKDKILMYCTGGIRCEKASAYVREVTNKPVFHLRGGIHKYLEEFDSTNEGLFEVSGVARLFLRIFEVWKLLGLWRGGDPPTPPPLIRCARLSAAFEGCLLRTWSERAFCFCEFFFRFHIDVQNMCFWTVPEQPPPTKRCAWTKPPPCPISSV